MSNTTKIVTISLPCEIFFLRAVAPARIMSRGGDRWRDDVVMYLSHADAEAAMNDFQHDITTLDFFNIDTGCDLTAIAVAEYITEFGDVELDTLDA